MKEHDIARALTDVSDDLLLEAESAGCGRRTIKFHRLIAAAAVIAMLAVTVGAATMGVTWNITKENRTGEGLALGYYKDYDGSMDFEKLEYAVPLTTVTLEQGAMQRVRDILWRYWTLTQMDYYVQTHDTTPEHQFIYDSSDVDSLMASLLARYNPTQSVEPSYTGMEQIEELLGITLDISPELREAIRNSEEGINMRIYTGYTVGETARKIEEKDFPEPIRIIISFELEHFAGDGRVTGAIHLPLTESEAQKGISGLSYSHENEGPIWQSTGTYGGREVCFFGNDPKLGFKGFCDALYATPLGGYILAAEIESPDPGRSFPKPIYDTAQAMLLPLLENLE